MNDMKNITPLPSGNFRVRIEYREEILGGTFSTLEEAIAIRDALKRKIVDGNLVPTKGASAAELGPRFLASRAGNRAVKDDTGRWHLHIATAAWARRPVSAVVRRDGMLWLGELKAKTTAYDPTKHGKRALKPLSWAMRRHCLNLARRFFQWCIDVEEILDVNPFAGLAVEREDGDEDEGYQEEWYLDLSEQRRLLGLWGTLAALDERDRLERWMCGFALATGLRIGELWCLHLSDVDVSGATPHVVVRYGSWDPVKERYRSPKGRKGEKKKRVVPLWGLGLESAKAWLEVRAAYLKMTPKTERERAASDYQDIGLMFPTERGRRRDNKPPRSWKTVVEAFGAVPRIGEKPWWHLLRHSCASSLISGAWGDRWALEDVQKVLGHSDIRTTQMYAHLAPSALLATATRAQAAFDLAKVIPIGRHAAVTASRDAHGKAGNSGHATEDSNLRPTAPEAVENARASDEVARRDGAVTALRHVLMDVAEDRYVVPASIVEGLEAALDGALERFRQAADHAKRGGSR